jgi:predicted DNA-binding WGR domain protein
VQEIFGVNRHIRWRMAEWGRIGSPGTVRHQVFSSVELTEAAALAKHLKIKTRRGYPTGCRQG